MRLGIDLDGVTVAFHNRIYDLLGIENPSESTWDSIFTVAKMSRNAMFRFCRNNRVFGTAEPIAGAIEGIQALIDAGHDIQFVTHRPDWAWQETYDWLLGRFDWPEDGALAARLHVISNQSKSTIPCDLYLDDSPHVLRDLMQHGEKAVRFVRPWNTDLDFYPVASVESWPEFVAFVSYLDWLSV